MEAMRLGHAHAQRYDALHEGLAMAGEGWALEMGVHRGTTLRMIAAERDGRKGSVTALNVATRRLNSSERRVLNCASHAALTSLSTGKAAPPQKRY